MTGEVISIDDNQCLSPTDVMKRLNISRAAVYRLFNTDDFPSFLVGERSLRVTKRDLDNWIDKQKKGA